MNTLDAKNLRKNFDKREIVKGITFEVKKGELRCHTKGHEEGNDFLFFRPYHVKIEKNGHCDGVITNRNFLEEGITIVFRFRVKK